MRIKFLQKGAFSVVIAVILILCNMFSIISVSANSGVSKKKSPYDGRKFDIAIVFDNSGSMYTDKDDPAYKDNKSWCRAKYSMEIFASMLDYEDGDKLSIFPMWPVTTNGKSNSKASNSAIRITQFNEVDKINKIYTPNPLGTPFTPVTSAYNYLKSSKATDKWLIVLTDGAFDDEKSSNGKMSKASLRKKLIACNKNNINVQYLGIGAAPKLKSDPKKNFYATKSSDTSLKDDLVDICNNIFERIELDKKYLKGKNLTLDVSMSSLIVFAQGKNAKIKSLKNTEGAEIKKIQDSGQIKYSTISAGTSKYKNSLYDDTLAGQVVTFDSCAKGVYTLDYSNVEQIQIFYEPDIYLAVSLVDSEGKTISENELSEGVDPGKYELDFAVCDSNTNEDVTDSELLKVDNIKGYTVDENGEKTEVDDGEEVELKADTILKVDAVAEYLDGHQVSMNDSGSSTEIKVNPPAADKLDVKVKVKQLDNWYTLLEHEDWKPIEVSVTRNGEKLSDEELSSANVKFSFSDDLTYSYKKLAGESAYEIYVAKDDKGKYKEPNEGVYKFNATVSMKDEYGRELKDDDSANIRITKYPNWVKWAIVGAAFLLLALLVLLYLMRKALPPHVSFDRNNSRITKQGRIAQIVLNAPTYRRNKNLHDGTLTINMPPVTMLDTSASVSATFKVKAVDRLLTTLFKPQKRRMEIISVNSDADEIIAGSFKYQRKNGELTLLGEDKPILEDDKIILKKNVAVFDSTSIRELKMDYLIIRKK